MIVVFEDPELLVQQDGWAEEDAGVINQYPTFRVKGYYFPEEFVQSTGRTSSIVMELVQTQYTDNGTMIIVSYQVPMQWLSPAPVVTPEEPQPEGTE